MKSPKLVNVVAQFAEHGREFPDYVLEACRTLEKGAEVKVGAGHEWFWVTVEQVTAPGIYIGKIQNRLNDTAEHGLQFEDEIQFSAENVYSIHGFKYHRQA